jgi:sugar/nucleoside kinase (ribokinase family)
MSAPQAAPRLAPRFVAVGDLMVDVAATGRGHDARVRLAPGGSAANAAVWAVALGAESAVVGRVGDDPAGRMLAGELRARGVQAHLSVDPEAPTGTFLTLDDAIRADRGANARMRPADLPAALDADAVLVSGYLPPAVVEVALARAHARWVALGAAGLAELPAGGNALLANEEWASSATGGQSEDAALALGERYRLVCVTRGPRGAVAALDGTLHTAESPAVTDVDPTGAGDAFAAGLLVALARGAPLAEALSEACRAGARAASTAGPWPVLK